MYTAAAERFRAEGPPHYHLVKKKKKKKIKSDRPSPPEGHMGGIIVKCDSGSLFGLNPNIPPGHTLTFHL